MTRVRCTSAPALYGQRAVSMDYNRALFGMRLAACRMLSHALPFAPHFQKHFAYILEIWHAAGCMMHMLSQAMPSTTEI